MEKEAKIAKRLLLPFFVYEFTSNFPKEPVMEVSYRFKDEGSEIQKVSDKCESRITLLETISYLMPKSVFCFLF